MRRAHEEGRSVAESQKSKANIMAEMREVCGGHKMNAKVRVDGWKKGFKSIL